jgi:hypothetical protein
MDSEIMHYDHYGESESLIPEIEVGERRKSGRRVKEAANF